MTEWYDKGDYPMIEPFRMQYSFFNSNSQTYDQYIFPCFKKKKKFINMNWLSNFYDCRLFLPYMTINPIL